MTGTIHGTRHLNTNRW